MSVVTYEPKAPKNKITAFDIITETIVDNPQAFSGRWWSVQQLRDELIHEYDLLRLQKAYGDMTGATQAIVTAVHNCGWMDHRGGVGLELEFRVRSMPLVKPNSLTDCYTVIDNYREIMRNWKDVCMALHDTSMVLRSMKLTTEQAQDMLNKAVGLSVLYRNQAKIYHDMLKERKLVKGEFRDPASNDIISILEDPRHVMQVSELKNLHGLVATKD